MATAQPTPQAEADVAWTQVALLPWVNAIGSVQYEIIVEVANSGSGWANLSGGDASYTVYGKDGSVLDTGSFLYTFPSRIGPGEKGYYVESGYLEDVKLADIGKAEPNIRYGQADGPSSLLETSNVTVKAEQYGDGLEVAGVVTNNTGQLVSDPLVGAIFFDKAGKPIGALYENSMDALDNGQHAGFKTSYPGTPPLRPNQVDHYVVFAFEFSFF